MKALILLLAATPLAMAAVDRSALPETDAPRVSTEMNNLAQAMHDRCPDTIREVREDRGQPTLDRGTARAGDPLLIAAVDHMIDGCHVLVMKDDAADVWLPPRIDAKPGLIPAL